MIELKLNLSLGCAHCDNSYLTVKSGLKEAYLQGG